MAFGSFDILHKGHEHYLREAKSYGDYLIVVVARDSNILSFKGKKPRHDEVYRLKQVRKLSFIDEAVFGHENNIFGFLGEYKPDIVCLGYDQEFVDEKTLLEEIKKRNLDAKIVRAKPFKPEVYKSSRMKE
ncbi:FAD synthase [Candidatus Woesearchaeota archaeon]|nr:FAD synthase [Candidatus Woesearchaeota archaeon]